jgi:hypothetical protein
LEYSVTPETLLRGEGTSKKLQSTALPQKAKLEKGLCHKHLWESPERPTGSQQIPSVDTGPRLTGRRHKMTTGHWVMNMLPVMKGRRPRMEPRT